MSFSVCCNVGLLTGTDIHTAMLLGARLFSIFFGVCSEVGGSSWAWLAEMLRGYLI